MKIDHLCHVRFTWDELKEVLADCIEMEANEIIAGTPKNRQLLDMAKQARKEHSYVEIEAVPDGVVLCIDGVAYTEEL